jgi:hypothetical protein
MRNIILSHSGKQHAYYTAHALNELDVLAKFYTSSYIKSTWLQNKLLEIGNQYWTRRFIQGVSGDKVDSNWRFELKEVLLRKFTGKSKLVQGLVYSRDVSFDSYVSKKIQKCDISDKIFWGFQGSCHESLKVANQIGMKSICELATAHVTGAKRILGEEKKLNPEWADSIDNLEFPSFYEERLEQEPHLADFVIAASEFTKKTLISDGINESRIIYQPLGFDIHNIPFTASRKMSENKFKLLYVGTVTQRKGVKYLLEAMKCLPSSDFELHIFGGIQGTGQALKKYEENFIYHPPVSQKEIYKKYKEYDALVLPTVFEGFGLVIVEAMAAGIPVITTSHSFGAELIKSYENGILIPIRDVGAIVKACEYIANLSEEKYLKLSQNARNSILEFSWDKYTLRLMEQLKKIKYLVNV